MPRICLVRFFILSHVFSVGFDSLYVRCENTKKKNGIQCEETKINVNSFINDSKMVYIFYRILLISINFNITLVMYPLCTMIL